VQGVTDAERCDAEVREIEAQLRAGNPDVAGLCLALADWSTERRLLNGLPRPDSEADGV
jgi:hypothetical protein